MFLASMAIKNGDSENSADCFWGDLRDELQKHINCLFKSILLKGTTGAEEIATLESFSSLCNILTCILSKKNLDIIDTIGFEYNLDLFETDLEKSVLEMIKNIFLKEPFDYQSFDALLPFLKNDMKTWNTPSEDEFDYNKDLYKKCYLCYYQNPSEDYDQTSLVFKEKDEKISSHSNEDIFEESFDNNPAILAKPDAVLRELLNISQGDHEAVLYFLKEF